jgi:hypothetical protein
MGTRDPHSMRLVARRIFTVVLNGLPECFCNMWPAGLHKSLEEQWIKDNLYNHADVT